MAFESYTKAKTSPGKGAPLGKVQGILKDEKGASKVQSSAGDGMKGKAANLIGPGGRSTDGGKLNPLSGGKAGGDGGPLFRGTDGGAIAPIGKGRAAQAAGPSGTIGPLGRDSDGGKINADSKMGAMKRRMGAAYKV